MKRVVAPSSEVRRKLDRFRAIRGGDAQLRELALEILPGEGNPELLAAALRALSGGVRIDDHGVLIDLYEHLDGDGKRRDVGGTVRVEVLNVLWRLRSAEDRDLAWHAATTREVSLMGNGQMIRAAGLALLGVLDPAAATMVAAEMLGSGDADRMTAQPALTAANLLAAQGEFSGLALYAHAFIRSGPVEVVAECLRALVAVPAPQLTSLLDGFIQSGDEVLLLGLCDFIVAHAPDPLTAGLARRVFSLHEHEEIYAYLATATVASRREDLLGALLASLKTETDRARLKIASQALELAAPSAAVTEARAGLAKKLGGDA
ncbi:MAG: hypothetical protein ABI782_06835 [Anaerolineaceae bacterium]